MDTSAEWKTFLMEKKFTPEFFGEKDWDNVLPSVQRWDWDAGQALPLPKKRLFYWSVQFSIFSSATAFARATTALEGAFYKQMPIYINFNNFQGRGVSAVFSFCGRVRISLYLVHSVFWVSLSLVQLVTTQTRQAKMQQWWHQTGLFSGGLERQLSCE